MRKYLARISHVPIHKRLNRICWDKDFAQSEFVSGFFGRLEYHIIEVPRREARFPAGEHFAFEFTGLWLGVMRVDDLYVFARQYRGERTRYACDA